MILSEQSRPTGGFAVEKIPISEILAYMDLIKIDDIEYRKLLLERIMILDNELVAHYRKKNKKENK